MAKPNVSINLSSFGWKIKNHLGVVVVVVLLCLFAGEGWIIWNSINLLNSFKPVGETIDAKGIRVDFTKYDAMTKQIDDAGSFVLPGDSISNPFTLYTPPK